MLREHYGRKLHIKRDSQSCLCSCHAVACGTWLFFITLRAGLRKKNVHSGSVMQSLVMQGQQRIHLERKISYFAVRACVSVAQFVQRVYLLHWELANTLIQLPVQQKQPERQNQSLLQNHRRPAEWFKSLSVRNGPSRKLQVSLTVNTRSCQVISSFVFIEYTLIECSDVQVAHHLRCPLNFLALVLWGSCSSRAPRSPPLSKLYKMSVCALPGVGG